MQANTDHDFSKINADTPNAAFNEKAQKKRRKDAFQSAIISSMFIAIPAIFILILRWYYHIEGFWGAFILFIAILELGALIPIWILLKSRLKEIEGGEEDVAAQY